MRRSSSDFKIQVNGPEIWRLLEVLVSLWSASNVSQRQGRLVARQCSRLIVVSGGGGGGEEKGSNGGDNSAEKNGQYGSKRLLPYALI
ncbi:hypothetical protein TorRG33x02_103900 [Trema orientale]|uniref:Uncharacterized protein n=1 Tax=Trema orientale TaxID=63057 RepID=A0A2P5F7D1_TREOI|nr:hypothetical protein TorRG33x02_103900 [Trema orientale]